MFGGDVMSEETALEVFRKTIESALDLLEQFEGWIVFRSLSTPHRGCAGARSHYRASYSWDSFEQRDQLVADAVARRGGRRQRLVYLNVRPVSDRADAHPGAVSSQSKDCMVRFLLCAMADWLLLLMQTVFWFV
jgi:hypothetical protein